MRVLVVDDEPINREVAEVIVTSAGHAVTTCDNGAQALEVVTAGQVFEVILMDVKMPAMDGIEATRRLRAFPATAGVVIICVTGSEETVPMDAGFDACLKKPYKRQALLQTLVEACAAKGLDFDVTNP